MGTKNNVDGPVSLPRFREAMVVVLTYCDQISESRSAQSPCDLGCLVRIKRSSLEQIGKHMAKRRGKTVDYLPWGSDSQSRTDGLATVKWDGIKTPFHVHVGHLEKTT